MVTELEKDVLGVEDEEKKVKLEEGKCDVRIFPITVTLVGFPCSRSVVTDDFAFIAIQPGVGSIRGC